MASLEELSAALRDLGAGGLKAAIGRTATRVGLDAEGRAKRAVTKGGASGLNVRTGRLRGSIAFSTEVTPAGFEVRLRAGGATSAGEPVIYARIHEEGGTVRPTKSKYLRIPLPPALTAAGVDRYPSPLRQTGAGVFRFGLSEDGEGLLFHVATGVPWYILKRQVTIPARPYLRPALEGAAATLPDLLGAAILARFPE